MSYRVGVLMIVTLTKIHKYIFKIVLIFYLSLSKIYGSSQQKCVFLMSSENPTTKSNLCLFMFYARKYDIKIHNERKIRKILRRIYQQNVIKLSHDLSVTNFEQNSSY